MIATLITPPADLDLYRADPTNERSWKGVAANDRPLLSRHIALQAWESADLYTRVLCGTAPCEDPDQLTEAMERETLHTFCKKIDAVVKVAHRTWVVEIKPAASYVALGQVLTYWHHARELYPELKHSRPMIITDAPDPDILHVARFYNVTVLSIPDATYVPQGRPC